MKTAVASGLKCEDEDEQKKKRRPRRRVGELRRMIVELEAQGDITTAAWVRQYMQRIVSGRA